MFLLHYQVLVTFMIIMMVDQREGKGEYIQWRPDESKLLIELVASCVKQGLIDPNGRMFKKTVETKILSVLNEKLNSRKTYKHYINRMKILKNQYRDFVNLLHFDPKFEWNPTTKKFTAPDEVWNAYLREFPNQRHVRYETFEEYENMKLVFGKNMAMRRFERSLSQPREVGKNKIPKQEVDLTNDDDVHGFGETASNDVTLGDPSDDAFSDSSDDDAPVSENEISAKILAELSSMVSAMKRLLHMMQERLMVEENKKKTVWDAITEIPNLSNHLQHKAFTLIQKIDMGDSFLSMSIEDRRGWIQHCAQ